MRREWSTTIKRIFVAAILVPASLEAGGPASAEEARFVGTLRVGTPVFWDGAEIKSSDVPDPALCGVSGPCFRYAVEVKPGGDRLRVAIGAILQQQDDVREGRGRTFRLRVLDPQDTLRARGHTAAPRIANEVFVANPVPGRWTIEVIPEDVEDIAFRMRAKLESLPSAPLDPPQAAKPLTPNLRIIPPYEFSFNTHPAHQVGGPSSSGAHPSCSADEVAEAQAEGWPTPTLCLRFSMGAENIGSGPLRLLLDWDCTTNPIPLTQRTQRSDGTWSDGPRGGAGLAHAHLSHLHLHYREFWSFELWRPADEAWEPADGEPVFVRADSVTRKTGLDVVNANLADWDLFYQRPAHPVDYQTEPPQCGSAWGELGLQSGWGDIYSWPISGNYIDFPMAGAGPAPGYYVVRGQANPLGLIAESNTFDNISYAFLHVSSDGKVALIERGHGTDPWDLDKRTLSVAP